MSLSPYIQKAFDEGYKSATVKFYPQLVASDMMVEELGKVVEGKNVVIFQQKEDIAGLEKTVGNYKLAVMIGVPTAVVTIAVLTILLVRR